MKAFYEFPGNWLQLFDKLVGVITPTNIQRFSIWQSKSSSQKNLLIVYELNLDPDWAMAAGIQRISESEFLACYRNKMSDHLIHGYNEYGAQKTQVFDLLKKITAMF